MDKIAKLFLWASTLIGLVLLIIGGVSLVNLGLRSYVFTKADSQQCAYIQPIAVPTKTGIENVSSTVVQQCQDQQAAQKQSDAATSTAELLVGAPVFLFFFKKAKTN